MGTEYEPYIFSALNTSRVMLSLGTKPEYFNAVWVKNEWSRFLKIMKKDRSKLLAKDKKTGFAAWIARAEREIQSCRKSQKAKQQSELASERLLTRAKQYAKGATQKQIEDGLVEITAVQDQRIAQAEEQDKQSIARAKTAYAKSQGTYQRSSNGNCWWWLRSPGWGSGRAEVVNDDGTVGGDGGFRVNYAHGCVRPALWIDLGS